MKRIVMLTLLISSIASCKEKAPESAPANSPTNQLDVAAPVVVSHPAPVPPTRSIRTTGRLEAVDQLQLSFKTGGVVAAVNVDIGDAVRTGQVLARLDSTEVDAEVKRAEENYQKAVRDLERADRLHAQGLVSQEIHENARTVVDVAEAGVQTARFNQTHATIVAPANGRVLARMVKGREMVAAGAPVLTVTGEGSGWLLRTTVSDKDAVKMAVGNTAQVSIDAWPDHPHSASISRIAGMADVQTGTFDVELALDALPKTGLRSGMIGRADISVPNRQSGVVVPVAALVNINNGVGQVFVVDAGRARLKSVDVGDLIGNKVLLRTGLELNDNVIVAGSAYVNDGQAVALVTQ